MPKKPTPAQISAVMREIGRTGWSKGGKAAAANMTPEQRRERARKASNARKANKGP